MTAGRTGAGRKENKEVHSENGNINPGGERNANGRRPPLRGSDALAVHALGFVAKIELCGPLRKENRGKILAGQLTKGRQKGIKGMNKQ